MCGRYRLRRHWEEDLAGYLRLVIERVDRDVDDDPLYAGSDEAFPRQRMPIIRRDVHDNLVPELRQWGYILMIAGKTLDANGTPKRIRRDVFNAMSEKLVSSFAWKGSFRNRRCLIPMSSWDEWPEVGGSSDAGRSAARQRVRVAMPAAPVFLAAGLYDLNVDPKTGAEVPVFTMCTVPPNAFLGTVHDRAPMILAPAQCDAWLAGSESALALVGVHPDADAFDVTLV